MMMVMMMRRSKSPFTHIAFVLSCCSITTMSSAAKEIRELGLINQEGLNIVGITGNVLPEDVRYFRTCGANDVLPKPVKMDDLFASWTANGVFSQRRASVQN